jgi:hypothetical protein
MQSIAMKKLKLFNNSHSVMLSAISTTVMKQGYSLKLYPTLPSLQNLYLAGKSK